MKFDYIDIGTSDFDTSLDIRKEGQTILLVEPIKYYLDKLPNGKDIYKANYAISNNNIGGKMFYIKEEYIKQYGMPSWLRGCNSYGKPHPTVVRFFKELKFPMEQFVSIEEVKSITFNDLIKKFKITSIGFLKIDTEGYDHIILKEVLFQMFNRTHKKLWIEKIKVEYNQVFENTRAIDILLKKYNCNDVQLIGDNLIINFKL